MIQAKNEFKASALLKETKKKKLHVSILHYSGVLYMHSAYICGSTRFLVE